MKRGLVFLFVIIALIIGGGIGWALRGTRAGAPSDNASAPDAATEQSHSSATAAKSGRCTADTLTATVAPAAGGGAAGNRYYDVTVTNVGSADCTINGYPGVSLTGANGDTVGLPADKDNAAAPADLTIARGKTATVTVKIAESGNYPAGTCRDGVTTLKLYPPDDTGFLSVPTEAITTWCPGFTTTAFTAG